MFSELDLKSNKETKQQDRRMRMQEDTVNHILATLTELIQRQSS